LVLFSPIRVLKQIPNGEILNFTTMNIMNILRGQHHIPINNDVRQSYIVLGGSSVRTRRHVRSLREQIERGNKKALKRVEKVCADASSVISRTREYLSFLTPQKIGLSGGGEDKVMLGVTPLTHQHIFSVTLS